MKEKTNILLGTTASGKTKYAIELAKVVNGVIINCDSIQVYKEIPILTAQPTQEEQQDIPHKLYGVIKCGEEFNVARWIELVVKEIKQVRATGKTPILVGGTGMYIKLLLEGISPIPKISSSTKALVEEYKVKYSQKQLYELLMQLDSKTAKNLKLNDRQRVQRALEVILETRKPLLEWQELKEAPPFPREDYYLMRIIRTRDVIYKAIDKRFLEMVENGVIDEVKTLYNNMGEKNLPRAHGLPELISYLKGEISLERAIQKSQQITRNYAKRQTTWFNNQLLFDQVIELY